MTELDRNSVQGLGEKWADRRARDLQFGIESTHKAIPDDGGDVAELELSQDEANALISMDKLKTDDISYTYPSPGELLMLPLVSRDRREEFVIDLRRGRIDLAKITHQLRARKAIVLLRLDLEGPPHRNPDGEVVDCPHLHIYREGFADKWAIRPPQDSFTNLDDRWKTLHDFFRFSHVVEAPSVEKGLFT